MAAYSNKFINNTYNPWILVIMIIIPCVLTVLSILLFVTACKKPYKEKIKLKRVKGQKKKKTEDKNKIDQSKFNKNDVSGKAKFFEKNSNSIN